ncbi:MAG: hypothetical protein J6S63_06840 [Atopobiaceae bacterium]|nr:hypothetical protein [Atopobiaceae bacterium]
MANEDTRSVQTEQLPNQPEGTSPKVVTVAMWVLTIAFVLGAIVLMPSLGGVIVLVGALLVCPAQLLRGLPPFKQLYGISGGGVMEKIVRIVIADALVLGGFALTPWRGGTTVGSLIDLQLANVSAVGNLEYSKDPIDVNDVVTCSSRFVKLSSKDVTPASEVGRHVMALQLAEGPFTKEAQVELVVLDTKPPVIKLKEKTVSVSLGEAFEAGDFIASVKDPVDGNLSQIAAEPKASSKKVGAQKLYDEGWYVVSPKVNTKRAGTQEVTVTACDQHGNKATKTLTVSVDDPLAGVTLKAKKETFEYAKDKLDATQQVTCSDASVKVSADERLDLSTVGKKTIVFTLSKGKSTKNESVEFTVRDTKRPVIELVGTTVTVGRGAAYNAFDNVATASDVVDGALQAVDAEPSENGDGWFTITGSYDTNVVGRYDLNAVACDKNGNREIKRFVLVVSDAPVEAAQDDSQTTVTLSEDDAAEGESAAEEQDDESGIAVLE